MSEAQDPLQEQSPQNLALQFAADHSTADLLQAARDQGVLNALLKGLVLRDERERCGVDASVDADDWRAQRWGDMVDSLFLEKRSNLERVSYWTLRLPSKGLAMEHYYQLSSGETSMKLLAEHNGGVRHHHATAKRALAKPLLKILRRAKPGVAQMPLNFEGAFHVLQLDAWIPATLDDKTKQFLLKLLEDRWVSREIARRLESDL